MSHTPGPWEARGLTIWEPGKVALSIATATQHQPSARANAQLIAAAPEMLAALKGLVDEYGRRNLDGYDYGDELLPAEEQTPEIAEAMRLIRKAEGKS